MFARQLFPSSTGKRKIPLTIIPLASASRERVCAGGIVSRRRPAWRHRISFGTGAGDGRQGTGRRRAAEAAPAAPKGKLKLIIAAVGVLLILGGGGAAWFFLFRHHGEEMHAEAPPPKPPVFVDVPDMLVNLVGAPGERVQYLKVKVVLEVKEEKQVEAIKPTMPRVTDIFQTYLRELRAERPQRFGAGCSA